MRRAVRTVGRGAALAAVTALAACGGGGGGGGGGGSGDGNLALPAWTGVTALGGATTNTDSNQSSSGFDTPASNLSGSGLAMHLAGDGEFESAFITAPSADFPVRDGLGPAFNNSSCGSCHVRDGRASYTATALAADSSTWTRLGTGDGMLLRIGLTQAAQCNNPSLANLYCDAPPVPGFGGQLLNRGVLALRPDSPFSGQADVWVRFATSQVSYGDGTTVTMHRPVFELRNPYDNPGELPSAAPTSRLLRSDVAVSARMGMPVFGLGLLEAIPEADILALADPGDADGDGISGRANLVLDPVKQQRGDADPQSLGRFGWKAQSPSVLVQGAGAYHADMGITSYLFPDESIVGTSLYASYHASHPLDDGQAAQGHEVSEAVLKDVMFYVSTLAVPARRNVGDIDVRRGAGLFAEAGCVACHHPGFTTGSHPGIVGPSGTVPVLAAESQAIYPFTDMLLHDMGDGLADERREFGAAGREWKTRPLWGVGLTQVVNPLAGFLHDGRARTLEEAVLWHGGEAQASRERFRTMNAADRAALLAFLKSL